MPASLLAQETEPLGDPIPLALRSPFVRSLFQLFSTSYVGFTT